MFIESNVSLPSFAVSGSSVQGDGLSRTLWSWRHLMGVLFAVRTRGI